jgi:uncharacterized protein YecT (DUF1311 family)
MLGRKRLMQSKRSALEVGSWLAGIASAALAAYAFLRPQPVPPVAPVMVQLPAAAPAPAAAATPTPVAQPALAVQPAAPRPAPVAPSAAAAQPMSPSFDCAKATQLAERLVCASPQLAVSDLSLVNAYREALLRHPERAPDLRAAQNAWLRQNRNACTDVPCIQQAYDERLRQLVAQ